MLNSLVSTQKIMEHNTDEYFNTHVCDYNY